MGVKLVLVIVVNVILLQTAQSVDCPACKKFSGTLPDDCTSDVDFKEPCGMDDKCYHIQIKKDGDWVDHIGCYKPDEVQDDLLNVFSTSGLSANGNLRPKDLANLDPVNYEYGPGHDPAVTVAEIVTTTESSGLEIHTEAETEAPEPEPIECEAGSYVNVDECSECPKGSYTAEKGSATLCTECEDGLVGNAEIGATDCMEEVDEDAGKAVKTTDEGSGAGSLSVVGVLVVTSLSWVFL